MPHEALLIGRDCAGKFAFPDDERRDLAAIGHFHAPSQCSAYRAERKSCQAESRTPALAPRFREFQQVRSTVICGSCGASTVVPFAETRGRAVYCSACFQRRRLGRDA